ncbi:gamma-glutamyltransferase [Aquibium microcysteis]|uniref:gamma-glutamyltransferase n=1 Tax=Aquibium microcysteis TaxID=675281 RepID=UPI00165D2B0C|nr:gamma-glutamyltransferase [Aquibium microcysteis]
MSLRTNRLGAAFFALLAALPAGALAQQATDAVAPEAPTSVEVKAAVRARSQMVVAANPIAAEAGLAVLRDGGSAADALVVVQTVLGLVEPQSSGLGGGGFLVFLDGATGRLTTIDGRETAPLAATPELFLGADGKPLNFFEAVVGGRSVGTPGIVRLMEKIHASHGRKPWSELFEPAARLADSGFAVSPRLAALIAEDGERLAGQPTTRAYFFDAAGAPLAEGARLANPDYADTLRLIGREGPDAFYEGPVAEAIVAAVTSHPTNPGQLALEDLGAYEAKERPAVCAPYRGYDVCGMGPPSSGSLAIGQILGMLSGFDLGTLGPSDPQSWRLFGDATRLAFADRGRYVADEDFVDIPEGLLDTDYLATRAALLKRETALPADLAGPGDPPWDKAQLRIDGGSPEVPATTHFVIVDAFGNVASMTSSVENAFGARLMAAGILLNNQLTDFSFAPQENGTAVANRVEPGKRPRSSMSPTIVMKDGRPAFALGSPGGSTIIPYVAQALIALIDWRMDMQEAVALPHLANRFGRYEVEAGTGAEALADDLAALGYEVKATAMNSGLHGVAFLDDGTLAGGADPRREGVAVGD